MQTNTNPVTRLTPAQVKAALALASGASISATARSLRVHRTTIHDWMNAAAFSTALDEARLEYIDLYGRLIHRLQSKARAKIEALLDSQSTPPHIALQAAIAILNRPMPVEPNELENMENATEDDTILQVSDPPATSNANVQNKPEPERPPATSQRKTGRNDPCPCRSGKKFKRCCSKD